MKAQAKYSPSRSPGRMKGATQNSFGIIDLTAKIKQRKHKHL